MPGESVRNSQRVNKIGVVYKIVLNEYLNECRNFNCLK